MSITFFARGTPRPQGSKRAVGRGRKTILVEMSRGLPGWRFRVYRAAVEAKRQAELEIIPGPIAVTLEFVMPRPKRTTRPDCDGPPDLDKLCRGVFDALTMAGLIEDDSRVISLRARKRWARESGIEAAGCLVTVRTALEINSAG